MDKAPVNDVINAIVENIGYNCRAGSDEEMENVRVYSWFIVCHFDIRSFDLLQIYHNIKTKNLDR